MKGVAFLHTDKKHRKKPIIILILVVLLIAAVLYLAANRYLIQHVKVNNALDTTDTGTEDSNTKYMADDWNYSSDTATVKINKVTTGTGNDTITYYTADVTLKDSSSLKSAFADNKFGQNIVEDTSVIASANNAVFAINGDYYGFRDDGIVIRNGKIFRDVPARTGLGKVEIDTNFGNHTIQGSNPRTGIGIISPNHYVFIVVDGRSSGYSKGMTLDEFSKLFISLGCTDAYNLDGGGSSTMYFMGRVVNNPLGRGQERGVSNILYIG